MDTVLRLYYDGKQYAVLTGRERYTYGVGHILLLAQFLPQGEILNWIRTYPYGHTEDVCRKTCLQVADYIFSYAMGVIVDPALLYTFIAAFSYCVEKCLRILDMESDVIEEYLFDTNKILHSDDPDHEKRFSLIGHNISFDNTLEFMTTCFNEYYLAYQDYNNFYQAIAADNSGEADEEDKYALEALKSLYSTKMEYQDIGCRICFDPIIGKFITEYRIRSLYSLLAFEYAHMTENGVKVKICANCGRLFIPEKRSDTIYCSLPAPDSKEGKSCRDIGAWLKHKNEMSKNVTETAYRKKYQYFNVAYNRHKGKADEAEYAAKRQQFKEDAGVKKKELKNGLITADEFIKWVSDYK